MKSFLSNLGFKMSLFHIWFMKNVLVFLESFLIICCILMFTGNINENTIVLGTILYPVFSALIDAIHNATLDFENIMDVLAIILSILTTLGIFFSKAKTIVAADLKNHDKIKLNMVKAGLYFDENGKIAKREDSNTSVVEDVKMEDTVESNPNVVSGVITAANELKIIMQAKLPEDTVVEEKEDLNTNLDDNINEIKETTDNITEILNNDELTSEEKVDNILPLRDKLSIKFRSMMNAIVNTFKDVINKIKTLFSDIKEKIKKNKSEDDDVVLDNISQESDTIIIANNDIAIESDSDVKSDDDKDNIIAEVKTENKEEEIVPKVATANNSTKARLEALRAKLNKK